MKMRSKKQLNSPKFPPPHLFMKAGLGFLAFWNFSCMLLSLYSLADEICSHRFGGLFSSFLFEKGENTANNLIDFHCIRLGIFAFGSYVTWKLSVPVHSALWEGVKMSDLKRWAWMLEYTTLALNWLSSVSRKCRFWKNGRWWWRMLLNLNPVCLRETVAPRQENPGWPIEEVVSKKLYQADMKIAQGR